MCPNNFQGEHGVSQAEDAQNSLKPENNHSLVYAGHFVECHGMAAAATRRRFGCETVRCDHATEIWGLSRTHSKRVLVERRGRLNLQGVGVNEFVVSTFVCVRECRACSGNSHMYARMLVLRWRLLTQVRNRFTASWICCTASMSVMSQDFEPKPSTYSATFVTPALATA